MKLKKKKNINLKFYSHGRFDIVNGVLSTNAIFAVIVEIHLLGRREIVTSAETSACQPVVVMSMINMKMIDVESNSFLFLSGFVSIQAVL